MIKIKQTKLDQKNFKTTSIKNINQDWKHYYIHADKRVLNVGDKINFNLFISDKPTAMSLFLTAQNR